MGVKNKFIWQEYVILLFSLNNTNSSTSSLSQIPVQQMASGSYIDNNSLLSRGSDSAIQHCTVTDEMILVNLLDFL